MKRPRKSRALTVLVVLALVLFAGVLADLVPRVVFPRPPADPGRPLFTGGSEPYPTPTPGSAPGGSRSERTDLVGPLPPPSDSSSGPASTTTGNAGESHGSNTPERPTPSPAPGGLAFGPGSEAGDTLPNLALAQVGGDAFGAGGGTGNAGGYGWSGPGGGGFGHGSGGGPGGGASGPRGSRTDDSPPANSGGGNSPGAGGDTSGSTGLNQVQDPEGSEGDEPVGDNDPPSPPQTLLTLDPSNPFDDDWSGTTDPGENGSQPGLDGDVTARVPGPAPLVLLVLGLGLGVATARRRPGPAAR